MKVGLIIIVLVLMGISLVYAYDDHDFQIWNTEVEEVKISESSKMTLEEEFRWGNNAEEFYYQHYDIGYVHDANEHLVLGINYRQVYERKNAHGKFKEENRPYINATVKWEAGGFKFDDRNRLEYRHFDYQPDSGRYRNKFSVKFPWKFTKMEIQPYLADEIFLSFRGTAFNRNRFYSGIAMSLTKNLKAELYYLLQNTRSAGKWPAANVLGTKIKLSF